MNFIFLRHLGAAFLAFVSSWFLVPVMIQIAHRWNILDNPDGKIKVHKNPTPYLGGVAVYLGFITTLIFCFNNMPLVLLTLGSTLLLFIGLIDDLVALKPWQKFLGQFFVVACFLKYGIALKGVFFTTKLNLFISGFWMLSVINAFNLVDIMDGLATTIAISGSCAFFIVALLMQDYGLSILFLALTAALLAFLLYNKPPAKIYLGDAGAMFIGGILAASPLLFSWSEFNCFGYLTPLLILAVPLLEVTTLVIVRSYLGIPFYKGSPHHFAIYLQQKGYSKKEILAFSFVASSCAATLGILFMQSIISLPVLIAVGGFLLALWVKMVYL